MIDPWAVIERYPIANVGAGTKGKLLVFLCTGFGDKFLMNNAKLTIYTTTYSSADTLEIIEK